MSPRVWDSSRKAHNGPEKTKQICHQKMTLKRMRSFSIITFWKLSEKNYLRRIFDRFLFGILNQKENGQVSAICFEKRIQNKKQEIIMNF